MYHSTEIIYVCLCLFNLSLIKLSLEALYYFKFSELGHVNIVSDFVFISSILMHREDRIYLYPANCLAVDRSSVPKVGVEEGRKKLRVRESVSLEASLRHQGN